MIGESPQACGTRDNKATNLHEQGTLPNENQGSQWLDEILTCRRDQVENVDDSCAKLNFL